jgi:tRNA G18 (ribose-2'-O)-methylase SpoU
VITQVADLDDPRVHAYRWTADPARLTAAGLVVIEGRLVVPRLLALSSQPGRWAGRAQSVLIAPAALARMGDVLAQYPDLPVYVAPQSLMDGLVGFNVHRGCLALADRPAAPVLDAALIAPARRIVVLEGVNNPDNVGGIFRSAAALGADLVVIGPSCADPLYRKCVRTSMGASLEVPYALAPAWPAALGVLTSLNTEILALTTASSATPIGQVRPRRHRVALLAGAEGSGLTEAALSRADHRVTIPMTGRVDSLNVATAVSIALYHLAEDPGT